ncbi:beta-lactamase [Ophiostoma piceae UAMH 11346]|uniref:Beta-lactamase n=1 Tax=Ophiostoma piceae (strain UAMH 11346) TaxID=1262450 RepID=S3BUI8_OPHP1|nr:beta-lactamase [Ophiostoma piceae UAMH 11346]
MAELDEILEKYTNPETGTIQGASFVAVGKNGDFIYRKAAGSQKANGGTSYPLTLDTVTWIASQTKLTTSVSVMQLVEKGLVALDDDVRGILPVLKDIKVITGFEDDDTAPGGGHPIFEDVKGPITLRQLVTHSSGFRYDTRHPLLIKYSKWAGRTENMFSGTIEGCLHPLIFQPGTSWDYGPGLDWAGRVIEAVTGMPYDEYQQEHIWKPLGAADTTFFPAKRGLTLWDIQETAERGEGGGLEAGRSPWLFECRDALGGAGLFSTANDYVKLLGTLLAGGGPLLSSTSVDVLFAPQTLAPEASAALRTFVTGSSPQKSKSWLWDSDPDNWRDYMEIKHCLCGLVNKEDVPGRRHKNTVNWDGLPNLLWFIDREGGVAATFFTQIMPPDDAEIRKLCQELETALYKIVDSK